MQHLGAISKKYSISMDVKEYVDADVLLFHLEDADNDPDLVLLDVQLPGMNGIEAAEKIREMQMKTEVIFLTKDPNHWPEAFDVDALHYLIKGQATDEMIDRVLLKAFRRIEKKSEQYMLFKCAGKTCVVPIDSIHYFSQNNRIITVHYGDKQSFEFYTSMGKLENEIFNKGFVRVHQSYIAALAEIKLLQLHGGAIMECGAQLPVGRTYYSEAFQRWQAFQRSTLKQQ
jgi:two-component system response regulator LytT